jgi:hypothetical protein
MLTYLLPLPPLGSPYQVLLTVIKLTDSPVLCRIYAFRLNLPNVVCPRVFLEKSNASFLPLYVF